MTPSGSTFDQLLLQQNSGPRMGNSKVWLMVKKFRVKHVGMLSQVCAGKLKFTVDIEIRFSGVDGQLFQLQGWSFAGSTSEAEFSVACD